MDMQRHNYWNHLSFVNLILGLIHYGHVILTEGDGMRWGISIYSSPAPVRHYNDMISIKSKYYINDQYM